MVYLSTHVREAVQTFSITCLLRNSRASQQYVLDSPQYCIEIEWVEGRLPVTLHCGRHYLTRFPNNLKAFNLYFLCGYWYRVEPKTDAIRLFLCAAKALRNSNWRFPFSLKSITILTRIFLCLTFSSMGVLFFGRSLTPMTSDDIGFWCIRSVKCFIERRWHFRDCCLDLCHRSCHRSFVLK